MAHRAADAREGRAACAWWRSVSGPERRSAEAEPAAYEWNVQHRSGRFQRRPEESLMLTGDQNMIEVNAVVHYQMARPDDFLFGQLDAETTVRTAAESALQTTVSTAPLDDVLTTGRQEIESRVMAALQAKLDRYGAGARVVRVKLLDVHPSLEVVDAFREVSGAFEEKNRLIDEAEGYRNEQIALARGNAEARLKTAAGLQSQPHSARRWRRQPLRSGRERLQYRARRFTGCGCTWRPWNRCCRARRS